MIGLKIIIANFFQLKLYMFLYIQFNCLFIKFHQFYLFVKFQLLLIIHKLQVILIRLKYFSS